MTIKKYMKKGKGEERNGEEMLRKGISNKVGGKDTEITRKGKGKGKDS